MKEPFAVYKVLYLSDNVGTELVKLMADSSFKNSYYNTVGAEFHSSVEEYLSVNIRLSIWEINLHPSFLPNLTSMYYKGGTMAIIFVDEESKAKRDKWIRSLTSDNEYLSLIFVVYYKTSSDHPIPSDVRQRCDEFVIDEYSQLQEVRDEVFKRMFYHSEFRVIGYKCEPIMEYRRGFESQVTDDLYNVILEDAGDINELRGYRIYTVHGFEVSLDLLPESMEHLFGYGCGIIFSGAKHTLLKTVRIRGSNVEIVDGSLSHTQLSYFTIRESDVIFNVTSPPFPETVESVVFMNNSMKGFKANIFSGCSALKKLVLSNCGLKQVPKFPVLKSVQILNLDDNRCMRLVLKEILSSFPSLKFLSIEKNAVTIDISGCEDAEILISVSKKISSFKGIPLENTKIKVQEVPYT